MELGIRTRAATVKYGLVGLRISWPNTLQMYLNGAVHGPIELLLRFDAAIVQPAIPRFPALAVRWFGAPRHVPPKNRLMKAGGLEHRPRVDALVEKDYQSRPSIVSDRKRLDPAPWPWQLVRGKVEGVQVRFSATFSRLMDMTTTPGPSTSAIRARLR